MKCYSIKTIFLSLNNSTVGANAVYAISSKICFMQPSTITISFPPDIFNDNKSLFYGKLYVAFSCIPGSRVTPLEILKHVFILTAIHVK